MKLRLRCFSVLIVLSIVGVQTSSLHSQSTPQSKLIEGAKKESLFMWKGKLLMDSTDYDWFGTLAVAWGKNRAVNYMKQLARQDLTWRRGHGLVAQLIGAGELPLGWAYTFRVERMKKEGAPVDWSDTFDPIVTTVHGIGVSSKAANPNTARLFVDFALSKRSQQMIRDLRLVPSRRDVEPLVAKMNQNRLKVKRIPKEVAMNTDQYAKEFREIFGL